MLRGWARLWFSKEWLDQGLLYAVAEQMLQDKLEYSGK